MTAAADGVAAIPGVLALLAHIATPGSPAPGGVVLNMEGVAPGSLRSAALRCLAVWAPIGVTLRDLDSTGLLRLSLEVIGRTPF